MDSKLKPTMWLLPKIKNKCYATMDSKLNLHAMQELRTSRTKSLTLLPSNKILSEPDTNETDNARPISTPLTDVTIDPGFGPSQIVFLASEHTDIIIAAL